MIKRIIEKIKRFFKKAENEPQVNTSEKDNVIICAHCNTELNDTNSKKSNEGSDGIYYQFCNKCNYVNRIENSKVTRPSHSASEIKSAYQLFKEAGFNFSYYKLNEEDEMSNIESL